VLFGDYGHQPGDTEYHADGNPDRPPTSGGDEKVRQVAHSVAAPPARRRPTVAAAVRSVSENKYVRASGLYVLVRLVGVALLALLAAGQDRGILDRLTAWDGQWYLSLVLHGYDSVGQDLRDAQGNIFPDAPLAFFPLYPAWSSGMTNIPGVGPVAAMLVVSLLSGIVAACGLVRLAGHLDPRPRVGLVLVALWAGGPMAIALSMTYTEALFCALAVWALVAVLERHWILAGACCVLAGLTRSTASVLIAVVVLAAAIAVWKNRDRGRAALCVVIAPLGLLGYWGYVAMRTGSLTGWADIEKRGWNTEFDGGLETLEFVVHTFATGSSVMALGSVLIVIATIVLTVSCARRRLPWPLTAYAGGVVVLIIGTAGLPHAKPRFLLPAMFVLLLPVVLELVQRRRSTMLLATGTAVALGSWYSAYALTGWPYAI
jgi:hypothetical protein